MPFPINLFRKKVLSKQDFQTQQILSDLTLNGHKSKSNLNLSAGFSDIMKNIVDSADFSIEHKIKEIPTGSISHAKGHQIIENLKKQIMFSGISLDKLVVNDQALTALTNFLVDAGFDEKEVKSCTEACKMVKNKSELRLSDLFASFSELQEPKSDKEQEPFLEISALPHLESILFRLAVDPERINNAMTEAKIEGKGINIALLASNLKKIICNSSESRSLSLNQKYQSEIEGILNPIGSQNKILEDGPITLEGLVAGLETLLVQKSDSIQSSRLLSEDLNIFLENIKIDKKVKDHSVIPGLVETIPGIETSGIEESKWFHFQLSKEKIESNIIKSLTNFWNNEKCDSEPIRLKEQKTNRKIFSGAIDSTEIRSESSLEKGRDEKNWISADRNMHTEKPLFQIPLMPKNSDGLFETLPIGFAKGKDFEISKASEKSVSINSNSPENPTAGLDNVESSEKENPRENLMPTDLMHWVGREILGGIEKGQKEINFDLKPLGLGRLQIHIESNDNRLKVHIAAEQQPIKEILVNHASDFKAVLMKQGLPFEILEIQNHNFDASMSDLFDKLSQSDSRQLHSAQKIIVASKKVSVMGASSLKKSKQINFQKKHAGIESSSAERLINPWVKEEPIRGVQAIFEPKESFEHLNVTNGGNETNSGFFKADPVEDKLNGMDRGVDAKQAGAEIFFAPKVGNSILDPLTLGVNRDRDFEILKVTAKSIPIDSLSDNPVNDVAEMQEYTGVPEQKLGRPLPVDIMDQVSRQILSSVREGQNKINFELTPSVSDRLQLHIENDDNRVKVRIVVEQQPIKEMFDAYADDFKSALIDWDLHIESLEVQKNYNFEPLISNSDNKSSRPDTHKLWSSKKEIVVSEAISEFGTLGVKESKQVGFLVNNEEIESAPAKPLADRWDKEERVQDVTKIFKPEKSVERLNTVNPKSGKKSEYFFKANQAQTQFDPMDGDAYRKQSVDENILVSKNRDVSLETSLPGITEDGNLEISTVEPHRYQIHVAEDDNLVKDRRIAELQPQPIKEMLNTNTNDFKDASVNRDEHFESFEVQKNYNFEPSMSNLDNKSSRPDTHKPMSTEKEVAVSEAIPKFVASGVKESKRVDFLVNNEKIESGPARLLTDRWAKVERDRDVTIYSLLPKGPKVKVFSSDNLINTTAETEELPGLPDYKLGSKSLSADLMDQVNKQILRGVRKGQNDGSFELKPSVSGHLRLHVEKDDNRLKVRIAIEQPPVREILIAKSGDLKAVLMDQGLVLESLEVQENYNFFPNVLNLQDKSNNLKYPSSKKAIAVPEIISGTEASVLTEFKRVDSQSNYTGIESNSVNDFKNQWIKEEQARDVKRILEPQESVEHLNAKNSGSGKKYDSSFKADWVEVKSDLMDRSVDARQAITETSFEPKIKNESLAPPSPPEVIEDGDFEILKTTTRIFSSATPVNMTSDAGELTAVAEQKFGDQPLAADVMDQVSRKILRSIHKGKNEINLELKPSGLGHLQLHIENDDDVLKVRILAEHQITKEMLVAHTSDLKAALMDQGLRLESLDIRMSYNFDQSFANSRQQSNKSNDRRRKGIDNKERGTGISLNRVSESTRRNKTLLDLIA